jgi:hypothetical protein
MIAPTPEQIRQITKDVLSRPEFQPTTSWSQLLTDRIFKWLRELAQWSSRNPDLSRLAVIVLSIILLLLVAHMVYTVASEFITVRKREERARRKQPLKALEGVAENWTEAFALARAAMDAGDSYRAIWIAHRILLSILDRMNRIKFLRWKTNTDYLRECGNTDETAVILSEMTSAYERVVYAHTPFDRLRTGELLTKVEELAARADA